ncbi:MAG: beta-propeller fold lactonase family protein [Nitrospirae bacterium]|nr:beta-propeller fold lactonase family protein [Nitrospirota bacterium]
MVFWLTMASLIASPVGGVSPSSIQRVYVVNQDSNSVSVIDATNLKVIAGVPTGSNPRSVNVDPQGRYFYVTVLFTRDSDDLVQVFDVRTNALLTSVIVGHQPADVVPDPAGTRLYVSSEFANTLSIISVPEFKVIETLKLKGKGPHGQVMTPDGKTVLTANGRSGDVSMVDVVHKNVDLIQLPRGAQPVALGVSRDGAFGYVTDAGLNQVHKIDVVNKAVVASLTIGKRPMQALVHPTHPFLYIPCLESDAVYKVDLDAWKVEKVIAVGKGPHGIAYTADGRYAYVTLTGERPEGRVAVLDTETDRVQTTIPAGDSPKGIAVLFGKNQGW